MRVRDYIQALYLLLQNGSELEPTLVRLNAYLKKRGFSKLYPQILRGLLGKLEKAEWRTVSRIIVARESDIHTARTIAQKKFSDDQTPLHVHTHIDASLIGGFVFEQNSTRYDQSYKRALLDAYQRFTS